MKKAMKKMKGMKGVKPGMGGRKKEKAMPGRTKGPGKEGAARKIANSSAKARNRRLNEMPL